MSWARYRLVRKAIAVHGLRGTPLLHDDYRRHLHINGDVKLDRLFFDGCIGDSWFITGDDYEVLADAETSRLTARSSSHERHRLRAGDRGRWT